MKVLDNETLPRSFKERSAIFLLVSRTIRDIEKIHPIDLLVYTKPEFEMIKQRESLFIRRLLKDAIELT